ncbi:LLM class flavin-dependent oxidoreductase [Streptosporangium pseudovulgare]|uniref:N5,N10-methylene tetrahydromethanopterin reductase n=1 Tax=Streptosporangium pseudovulgare TaxID=35765 RepID=A0ABQ2QZD8_9ACTN|nr:LLM class flavin-dependent oxidoreductase [Streptosporangium pseudovulgare]GGQ05539.1 N5,N10-methylene tetrahydromethanopterin reductase [Streptosporangium pseudovulgare]
MTTHPFRFGVVAAHAPNAEAWAGLARRAENLGYATLLVPDTLGTFSPFTAAAVAATVTVTLRVGTYVLSAPYRTPEAVAWETSTLRTLTGGRFELGIGAGRPHAEQDAAVLGVGFGTPAQRVERVERTVDAVRDVPVLIAAAGPRLLRLAARKADVVALGVPPQFTEEQVAARLDTLSEFAGDRRDRLEVNMNLAAVGDEWPGWLTRQMGVDPREVAARGGTGVLTGTADEMVETLRRRRDRLGVSYVSVNAQFMEEFAPVVARLAGT